MNKFYLIGAARASGGNGDDGPKKIVSGRSLAHRKLNARQKAAIVAQVLLGEKELRFSRQQLVTEIGACQGYVDVALQLSPDKRQAIASGEDETAFTLLKRYPQLRLRVG